MQGSVKRVEYESIGSTNAEAKEYAIAAERDETVLFSAREQTKGRGRLGRSFLSRQGQGIYMSLLYFTKEPLCDAVSVTTAAAVCTVKAIEKTTGKKMKIKWVNDIYNERGKVAGILTETVPTKQGIAVIVGIGINIGKEDFPEELKAIAASIGEISESQRESIINNITELLLSHAQSTEKYSHMEEYRERSMLIDSEIDIFKAGEKIDSGRVIGIENDGGLVYIPDEKTEPKILHTGEVSVRKH